MRVIKEVAAVAALIVAGAGMAKTDSFSGAEQIARGDFNRAERTIVAQQRAFPRDADLLLNLAFVYARTSRSDEARQLYRAVLDQPEQEMDRLDGRVAGSHVIAREGLARLPATALALR